MSLFKRRGYRPEIQYLISVSLIIVISIICFLVVDVIGYKVVALILLLALSIMAMLFDIFPVMVTAVLSALIWNFFFIPPILTLHIGTPEDALMFLMYFVVALINAVLTFKIREYERDERNREQTAKTIALYNTLLNSLSHELRTPISTIVGAIDTIKEKPQKLSENNIQELYAEIENAGLRLNRQVENLLNMSRLEAGVLQTKLDWHDLNEIIFTIINNNAPHTLNHTINFTPNEELPLIKTDRGFLEQILHNIIHNALQHTPDNSCIVISTTIKNNICDISIIDNGKGFPEEEIFLVFNKFYRLRDTTTGGTGLGLPIAKGFANALGGDIILTNQPEGGAHFLITIPVETSTLNSLENE